MGLVTRTLMLWLLAVGPVLANAPAGATAGQPARTGEPRMGVPAANVSPGHASVSGDAAAAGARPASARDLFERGVALSKAGKLRESASAFEAAVAMEDRAAARFNLVLLSDQLQQPLRLVRHALAFLAFPAVPERAAARARVSRLLRRATDELAVLTTDPRVDAADLRVDGAPIGLRGQDGKVFVVPGEHQLSSRQGARWRSVRVSVQAGEERAWKAPDVEMAAAPLSPVPASSMASGAALTSQPARADLASHPLRTRLAWTLGMLGISTQLAALGTYLTTELRADALGQRSPLATGYLSAADQYWAVQRSIVPLAFAGGTLMAGAVALGPEVTRERRRGWSWAALGVAAAFVGAGTWLAVREPRHIVYGSDLEYPTRQAGALLATSAMPALSFGLGRLLRARRRAL